MKAIDIQSAVNRASSIISDFSVVQPEQIDLEAIAMGRRLRVFDCRLVGSVARLVRSRRGGGLIRVDSGIGPNVGRRRFALAHEIGHWELHEGFSQGYVCTDSDMVDYKSGQLEVEANYFAAELLMPTSLFRGYCVEVEPAISNITELASYFRVSRTAAAIRFVEECQKYCIVVFSLNSKVQYWRDGFNRKNGEGRRHWIPSDFEIGEGTVAWDLFRGGKSIGSFVEIDPQLWLPATPAEHNIRLLEQSIPMGASGVMSLLWILDR